MFCIYRHCSSRLRFQPINNLGSKNAAHNLALVSYDDFMMMFTTFSKFLFYLWLHGNNGKQELLIAGLAFSYFCTANIKRPKNDLPNRNVSQVKPKTKAIQQTCTYGMLSSVYLS